MILILIQRILISWQRKLGYVPQQISLIDASVAENIAFGVDKDEIDMETVEYVSRIANLHDFVSNNLQDGYKTSIGERGKAFWWAASENWSS